MPVPSLEETQQSFYYHTVLLKIKDLIQLHKKAFGHLESYIFPSFASSRPSTRPASSGSNSLTYLIELPSRLTFYAVDLSSSSSAGTCALRAFRAFCTSARTNYPARSLLFLHAVIFLASSCMLCVPPACFSVCCFSTTAASSSTTFVLVERCQCCWDPP